MRAIFISYRRDDTEGYAGRLFQDLRERFGKDSVFMDVAGIEPGRDFRRVIEQQVASCGVLLAVIGKSWLTVVDQQGQRRLDDAYDFVRLETASALKRDIPVIPVLVQQAEMPRPEQLPEDLKDLAFRNSVELSHARWESDVELLIAALTRYIDLSAPTAATAAQASAPRDAPAASRHRAWVIAPLATLAIGGIGYAVWDRLIAGGDETKETAAPGVRMGAASAPELVRPTPIASAPRLPSRGSPRQPRRRVPRRLPLISSTASRRPCIPLRRRPRRLGASSDRWSPRHRLRFRFRLRLQPMQSRSHGRHRRRRRRRRALRCRSAEPRSRRRPLRRRLPWRRPRPRSRNHHRPRRRLPEESPASTCSAARAPRRWSRARSSSSRRRRT